MAVIEGLIKGKDGHVQAAKIRTSTGRTNRPIARLYPLEVSSTEEKKEVVTINDTIPDDSEPPVMKRTVRDSAMRARCNISNWADLLLSPAPEDVKN